MIIETMLATTKTTMKDMTKEKMIDTTRLDMTIEIMPKVGPGTTNKIWVELVALILTNLIGE
jgi:hypothetical protein